jgi:hypothetical protein
MSCPRVGAVSRRHPGEAGLELPDGHLVAPVEALLVRGTRTVEANLPAHVAHAGVAERLDQAPQRVGAPVAVRVREREHLAARALHRGIERRHLAAAGELQDLVGAGLPRRLGRSVRGAVRRDDHLQPVARVVERQRIVDLAANHVLLVVRGDDQRHRRQRVVVRRGWAAAVPSRPCQRP